MTSDLGIEGLEDPVEVGVGGFATVYKVFQPAFQRTVAVKVLAALNMDDAAKERFERECQAMGALSDHPNIVTVFGAGFTESGRPYLLMGYLPGGSLADRIETGNLLSWQEASLIGVHLAGALETAHRAGVIHRDIKPGNVLMSAYGDAQLTDFGIARISGGHETRSGVITASMAHAPPEVLDGQRPSVLADVYSLGSTLFELLHGTPAFQVEGDESMVPMLRRILTEDPPDLRSRGVSDAVCQVIERSMAKEPGDRQQSAVEFGRELQAARRAEGADAGKLTVPAEVEAETKDAGLTYVAGVAAAICPSCSASLAPGSEFCGECGADVAEVMKGGALPPGQATSQQAPPGQVTTAGAAPTGAVTAQVYPPAAGVYPEPASAGVEAKKSKKGLLVGIAAVLVVVLVGLGVAGAIASKDKDGEQEVVTGRGGENGETSTTDITTEEVDYSPRVEKVFVERCAADGDFTPAVCGCIFEDLKDTVPFARFKELNEMARNNEDLNGTELQEIVQACVEEHAEDATTTAPTIPGLDGETG